MSFFHCRKIIFIIKIISFLTSFIITQEIPKKLINFSSEIHLLVLGSGNQSILNNSFYLEPSEVIVNGISSNLCKKFCELDYEENNVTLYFNETVESCYSMFYQMNNIKRIDLSNFDFSSVTDISHMFRGCTSLEKINFGNANTSSVQNMVRVFHNCSKLTSLNLSSFETSSVKSMEGMFYHCAELTSIDLSNFNTKNVKSLRLFFYKCEKLTSVDLSNFDTSKVTSMSYLFRNCILLKKINLGYMNTASLINMECLFYNCTKLESIDLSIFDTSLVTNMGWMFFHCYDIKYIILSESFKTSNVVTMYGMFSHCKSLISLNLSSFDTSKVTEICYMFKNCVKLKYLDISNFAPLNLTNIREIFYNITSLIYLNVYSLEINSKTNKVLAFNLFPKGSKICANQMSMQNYLSSININSNCSDICFEKGIKLDIIKNECIKSCKDNGHNYSCNGICYEQCPENSHVIIKNISNKNNIFEEYEDGVAKCFYKPEGYYLDEDGFYEECFKNCKFCYGPGNETQNNCIMCKENYLFISDSIYKNNCYPTCKYYYYFNETNHYICTENCSGIYNKLIIEKKRCIDDCKNDDIYKYEYNNICYKKCPNGTIFNQKNNICLEEQNIQSTIIFTSENYNYYFSTDKMIKNDSINYFLISDIIEESNISMEINKSDNDITIKTNSNSYIYNIDIYNNKINEAIFDNIKQNLLNDFNKVTEERDLELETKNILITMTNTHNQKYNLNPNKTIINLGDCETKLKELYNISNEESLYILKIDKIEEGMKIPKIEYEIYYPLNISILTRLDLTICKDSKIDISIPVKIDDNIEKYNSSSDYYNDICSKTTSESGTDISLTDRKNQFKENNMSLCEEDCDLVEYNYTTEKAKCSCLIKINLPLIDEIKFDKDKLYKSFTDINNILNIKLIKCAKDVFNKKSLSKNYGFFIYIFIFLLFFICLLLFYFKYYFSLKKDIDKMIIAKRGTFKIDANIKKTDNIEMGKLQTIVLPGDINNQKEEPEINKKKIKKKN